MAERHERTTVAVLGYDRVVCADCGTTWPCVDFVKERCVRLNLDRGLACECGWHEKVAQDPEQEKTLTQSKRDAETPA